MRRRINENQLFFPFAPRTEVLGEEDSFRDFILDQLSSVGNLSHKKMFGSTGIYCDGDFFAILSDGELYFKTTENTVIRYQLRGMTPFTAGKDRVLKSYYKVPPEIIDDRHRLAVWAEEALSVIHS